MLTPTSLTYEYLRDEQRRNAQLSVVSKQTVANRLTALNLFLRANHLHEQDVVGEEFRAGHGAAIEPLVAELRREGRSERSIGNTRSALMAFKKAVVVFDTQLAVAGADISPFHKRIKEVLSAYPIRRVAKQCAIPPDMLFGWRNGKWPRISSICHLRRLESFFGLERESLVFLAGFQDGKHIEQRVGDAATIEYRVGLARRSKENYWLRVPCDSELAEQWRALLEYKTAAVPFLERSGNGRWTLAPLAAARETSGSWWAFLDGREVPSARMGWARVASYLGWLSLPAKEGGGNVPVVDAQTLAWFAVPEFIEKFLDWMKARAGGKHTGTTREFLAMVRWLCRPGDGYLYQMPHLVETLPRSYRGHDWKALCERQHKYAGQLNRIYQPEMAAGRDPFEPITTLVNSQEPMQYMMDMVARMRADRPIGRSLRAQAVWARDLFVVELLLSNPIRLRNLACLQWHGEKGSRGSDKDGVLYQRDDGSWWIYIPKRLLKNRASTASIRDYHAPVHRAVWPDLERYIFKFRPVLQRAPTNLVILTLNGGRAATRARENGQHVHLPYMDIGRTVFRLTRKYLWKSDGIGPHAFRHIVATAILKAPGGDVKTAAQVLNDKETTVEEHYAWLSSGDGSQRMAELLKDSFSRL
ncbi:hypothetical protein [Castellaniella sp. MT123]|uniref:hypothetical protein n=1 Tax=Castellaniella sp. MT123 TaxID=3140381 RepID=UPI0031F40C37